MSKSVLIATDITEETLRELAPAASTGPFYIMEDDGPLKDQIADQIDMLRAGAGSCHMVTVADEDLGLPEALCVATTGNGKRSAANAKWIAATSPEVVLRILDGLHNEYRLQLDSARTEARVLRERLAKMEAA